MYLQKFHRDCCCLCGDNSKPTREHKIKASALRKVFGSDSLVIGRIGETKMKLAQSANSNRLKFNIPICELCNTARTQKADKEFDRFHQYSLEQIKYGKDPLSIFDWDLYTKDSEPYLNIFRYFAKLLCCHLAELNGPIPIALAQFAIGEIQHNCIWLEIKADPTYQQFSHELGEHAYAAHGGLIVYGDKQSHGPNAFHSSLTIGPVQYVYHMRLHHFEINELKSDFRIFFDWCVSKVEEAIVNPISELERIKLGLKNINA
nr:hypothetical protein [uncultured Tolumonas sp.]